MKYLLKYMLFIPLLAAVSCSKEHPVIPHSTTGVGEKDILLKVAIPYTAPKDAATRSIGATQENTIETLDVLAFKVESGVETFLYKAVAKKDVGNVEGNSLQTFNVKLRVQDYEQRFVLITNAHDKIENLIDSHLNGWIGEEKEDMLKNLTFDMNSGSRWNAISNSNYTAIPMWGETVPKVISATTTSISDNPIPMLRMVAKIEVQLDESVPNLTNIFKLKSVRLYNTNTSGRIVPMSGTEYVGTDMIARKASLPYPVTPVVGPLVYTDFTLPGDLDVAMRGAIYLFETAAKNAGNPLQETCIVVGGHYGTDNYESYYRLDFFASGDVTYLDVLRNHKYTFSITAVDGRGYSTVDEAYNARSFNMKTNLLVWDENDIRYIYFDNQYMLGVSRDYIELNEDAYYVTGTDNVLKVVTDYPTGWTAAAYSNAAGTISVPNDAVTGLPWLRITPNAGAGGAQLDDMFLIADENNSGSERTAYIHIKAGRLSAMVTVVQTPPGAISVTDLLILGHKEQKPAVPRLTVESKRYDGSQNPNASWTLTVPAGNDWLTLSLTNSESNASKVVSGTGTQDVYVFVTSNSLGAAVREETVTLSSKGNNIGASVIRQNKDLPPSESVSARASATGAFWRWNQTGERIIQINMGQHSGAWMAMVSFYDSKWDPENGDGILLAASGSPDITVGTNNPDDAENYKLTGNNYTSVINGTALANSDVTFRIGLQKNFTAFHADNNPARYAVLELWYADHTRMQRIYLRQGEGADYVMNRYAPDNRIFAVKISPYNLTAEELKNDMAGVLAYAQIASNRSNAAFTEYPTQIGAFFQFSREASDPTIRYAWNSHFPTVSNWNWNQVSYNSSNESCPNGYRRPDDARNAASSEIRQSLWLNPQSTTGSGQAATVSNIDNYLYGYYADGFYDRRAIDRASGSNGIVAAGTKDAAYGGGLFYNPTTGASLFLPVGGYRSNSSGNLNSAGFFAYYITRFEDPENYSYTYALSMQNEGWLVMSGIIKSQGNNIRCVKIP